MQHLLDLFVSRWEDVLDDWHQERWLCRELEGRGLRCERVEQRQNQSVNRVNIFQPCMVTTFLIDPFIPQYDRPTKPHPEAHARCSHRDNTRPRQTHICLPIQRSNNDPPHRVQLDLIRSLLQRILQILGRRRVDEIIVNDRVACR
jgi:hypothetical protein